MSVPPDAIEAGANLYWVYAFDEGTSFEIRQAKDDFNRLVSDQHAAITRSTSVQGYHRPTMSEFRSEFITQCRSRLFKIGKLP